MKKLIVMLLTLIPVIGFSQYVQIATHYDAETTAHHIIHGHIRMYVSDSVTWVVEKKGERYIKTLDCPSYLVKSKLDKVFAKDNLEYVSRTNGGYIFTIAVVDREDDINVINYCTFHVNAWTQKITEIEILLGE